MIFSLKRILLKNKQADLAMASQGLKLGSYLKEFRIFLCQKSSSSSGIRDFIQKHYISMKKANPSFPILIRECSGIEPKIFARYEFGKETSVPLSNLKSDQVLDVVKKLASEKKMM